MPEPTRAPAASRAVGGIPILRVPLFAPGRVVATPRALRALLDAEDSIAVLLARHLLGDWGDVIPAERARNDRAVSGGEHLLSEYPLHSGQRIWIVTEADRSVTTVLVSDEY